MTDITTPTAETKDARSKNVKPLKLIAMALTAAAIIKELRLPKDQRTWNGLLAGFVPYDFRKPTMERIREALWNPDGKLIVGRPFGVGWTLNLGAVVAKIKGTPSAAA